MGIANAYAQTSADKGVVINGVKWATTNLGASSKTDAGSHYAWVQAKTACPRGWRMPTYEEFDKLVSSGSVWTSINGVQGRLFGKAPNTIFLPAAGVFEGGNWFGDGSGWYWGISADANVKASCLLFDNNSVKRDMYNRILRMSVRCVAE